MTMICRRCQAPAVDVRRDWGNERVTFTYVHSDGSEHAVQAPLADAQELRDEDDRQRLG